MSICINNDLIWLSVPKCASMSVEHALMHSELKTKYLPIYEKKKLLPDNELNPKHWHYRIDDLYNEFGLIETFCVYREPTERFVSALGHVLTFLETKHKTIIKWVDVDNQFIYQNIDEDFFNDMESLLLEDNFKCYQKLVNEKISFDDVNEVFIKSIWLLKTQNFWKFNQKCTYEFNIKNLKELEEFIYSRYDVKINIPRINESAVKSKIVFDEKIIGYITNLLSKPYHKKKKLL